METLDYRVARKRMVEEQLIKKISKLKTQRIAKIELSKNEQQTVDELAKRKQIIKKIAQKTKTITLTEVGKKLTESDLKIHVIEHLTPYQSQQFISASWRILKPRGYIFLITPNFVSPLRLILGKRWFGYSDPSHIQFFTPSSLANLLKLNGFGSVTCRLPTAYNVPFDWYLPVFFRKLPMPLKNLLNYLMISSPLSTWRDSFWILGQK